MKIFFLQDCRYFILCINIAFLISVVSCYSLYANPPANLEEIKIGIEKQFAEYDLCEFTYIADYKNPKGEMVKRKNTYRLHLPQKSLPIQCLIEESPQDGEYQIENFIAFNGEQSHIFKRNDMLKGKTSDARIVAFNMPENFLDDSFVFLITSSIVGLPFTILDPHQYETFWKQKKDTLNFDTTQTLDGYETLVCKNVIQDIEYEIHVLKPPNCMIVRTKATNLKNKEISYDIKVQKIGKFGDVVFPEKGHVYRKFALTHSSKDPFIGVDYSFEVLNVRRLDKFFAKEWNPKFPPGTLGKNDITGETIKIPFSDKQREKFIKNAENSVPPRSPIEFIFRVLFIVVGIVMLIFALYCRLKQKS
ncbi:MAG: hypothetical protein LBP59_11935 [Planctomycetaceae bacterium]|jgi:hypothetical protein|nr:hypothetical protein [Planctomycetaceae bacterium]